MDEIFANRSKWQNWRNLRNFSPGEKYPLYGILNNKETERVLCPSCTPTCARIMLSFSTSLVQSGALSPWIILSACFETDIVKYYLCSVCVLAVAMCPQIINQSMKPPT